MPDTLDLVLDPGPYTYAELEFDDILDDGAISILTAHAGGDLDRLRFTLMRVPLAATGRAHGPLTDHGDEDDVLALIDAIADAYRAGRPVEPPILTPLAEPRPDGRRYDTLDGHHRLDGAATARAGTADCWVTTLA